MQCSCLCIRQKRARIVVRPFLACSLYPHPPQVLLQPYLFVRIGNVELHQKFIYRIFLLDLRVSKWYFTPSWLEHIKTSNKGSLYQPLTLFTQGYIFREEGLSLSIYDLNPWRFWQNSHTTWYEGFYLDSIYTLYDKYAEIMCKQIQLPTEALEATNSRCECKYAYVRKTFNKRYNVFCLQWYHWHLVVNQSKFNLPFERTYIIN